MVNKKRLIDADFLKVVIKDYVANNEVLESFAEIAGLICDMLDACETVDAVEVVHGRWVIDAKNHCHCSHCCCGRNIETQIWWEYCPHCGAKMDGDRNG